MSDYLSMSLEINRLNEIIAEKEDVIIYLKQVIDEDNDHIKELLSTIKENEKEIALFDFSTDATEHKVVKAYEQAVAKKDKEIERLNKTLSDINKIRMAKIRSLEDIISEIDGDL